MGEMDEDRVYDDRRRETVAYLATGQGVATVRVASDRVGRFSLAHRCDAREIATADGRVYVATPAGVLAGDGASDGSAPGGFDSLGFDDAVAVTADGERVLAANGDGTVARYRGGEWRSVGTVGDVRALSGAFVAAADGVYRVVSDGDTDAEDGEDSETLRNVGLDDVRDVAGEATPLAATGDGLYRLGNGWLCEREEGFETVAAGRTDSGDRAHAATTETLYAHEDGGWTPIDLPVAGAVTGVAYGECVYAVTRDGTFLVAASPERTADGTGGWRHRSLGLPDVTGLAVV
jgi:hypothetical protein